MIRVQTDSGVGDLIFLAVALVLVVLSVRAIYLAIRRRPFARTLAVGGTVLCGYAAVLVVSGLLTPQTLLPPGAAKCSDEWCVSVNGAKSHSPIAGYTTQGRLVAIAVRVFSEARGRSQRGSNPAIYVLDEDGRRYLPSPVAQAALDQSLGPQPPLTKRVGAGESFLTEIAFDLPVSIRRLRVNVAEQPWITRIVLFNDNSLFAGGTFFDLDISVR